MMSINWESVLRHVYAYWGHASEFRQSHDASGVMALFKGRVMWLDTIEAERGQGTAAMEELMDFAKLEGVRYIGLQVVPLGHADEAALVRFYQRHGFVLHTDLAQENDDFPVMVADLHRSFAGVTT